LRSRMVFIALIAFAASSGQATPARYAEGQVWEYKTRVGDEASLLKIQRIEPNPAFIKSGSVYHISVVGFRFQNPKMIPVLPHAPVTEETLDASVTTLSQRNPEFPSVDPGITEWRQANGGVFTISVAEIIEILDRQTTDIPPQ
jgi:hypothetical protein